MKEGGGKEGGGYTKVVLIVYKCSQSRREEEQHCQALPQPPGKLHTTSSLAQSSHSLPLLVLVKV